MMYKYSLHLQVRVGYDKLVGEVIRIDADKATIQVYEETGTYRAASPLETADHQQLVSLLVTRSSEHKSLCPSNLAPG